MDLTSIITIVVTAIIAGVPISYGVLKWWQGFSKKLSAIADQVSKATTTANNANQLATTNVGALQDIQQAYNQLNQLFNLKQQENEERQAELTRSYQRDIQELKDRNFEIGIENTSLNQKVAVLEQQLHTANDRIDELVRNIRSIEGQKDSLLSQNQTLIRENRRYRQQNDKLVAQILQLGGRPSTTNELQDSNNSNIGSSGVSGGVASGN